MKKAYPLKLPFKLTQPVNMYVHEAGDRHVSQALKESGQWEIFETELLAACLTKANNFIDVGANIGYYSMIAAKLNADLSIFSFEPEPRNADVFVANKALNQADNIHFQAAGLASVDKNARIFLSEDNFGDHQIYDRGESRASSEIALLNGAQYLSKHISAIDVLKIDTQGAEFEVISGLMPLLVNSESLQMVIEFWPFGLRKAGSHGHHLLDLLMQLALPIHIIDHIEHKLIPCDEASLRRWIDSLDADDKNEGFMNLFFGQPPANIAIGEHNPFYLG